MGIVAIMGMLWLHTTRVSADEPTVAAASSAPHLGHSAPDFTLTTLEGEHLTLSDLRGQPVVLNFWATWCPPCRAEVPALGAVSDSLEGGAIVLGVDVGESARTVSDFVAERGVSYPIALDGDSATARLYGVRVFPTTYLLDANGVIVEIFTGPVTEPLLRARLDAMIGE
jgi:thiol-disulfide isomerase/thioredoxin